MDTTFIYTLRSPISNEIRYIGKSNQPRKRLYSHIKECNNTERKSHKINWIKSLLEKGVSPIIEIIDEVPSDEWEFWEKYWISQFITWGFNLTNISPGGYNNNYKRSDETRKKMSDSKLGSKLSECHKENISKSIKLKAKENPLYNRGLGNSRIYLDKDELYQKYIIENLSLNKCSSFFNVSKKTVFTNITEYGYKKNKGDWKHQLYSRERKVVLQYDKLGNFIKEWINMDIANENTGVNKSNIASCCRGSSNSAGGFIWKYKL